MFAKQILSSISVLLLLTSCSNLQDLGLLNSDQIKKIESDFTQSEFFKNSQKIAGKNANQVYYSANQSVFRITLNLALEDIFGKDINQIINPAKIEEFYLIENNQSFGYSNYESYLIIVYPDSQMASQIYSQLQNKLNSSTINAVNEKEIATTEPTLSIFENQLHIQIGKANKQVSPSDYAKLIGSFLDNPFFNPQYLKYSPQVLFSAAFSKQAKDLHLSFFELLMNTQDQLSSPEYDPDLVEFEKIKATTLNNQLETLTFNREKQDSVNIIATYSAQLKPNIDYSDQALITPIDANSALEKLHQKGFLTDISMRVENDLVTIQYTMPEYKFSQ